MHSIECSASSYNFVICALQITNDDDDEGKTTVKHLFFAAS